MTKYTVVDNSGKGSTIEDLAPGTMFLDGHGDLMLKVNEFEDRSGLIWNAVTVKTGYVEMYSNDYEDITIISRIEATVE